MLQLRTLLAAIGPVVLAVSEHDGVVFCLRRKSSSGRHAFTKNGEIRRPEGSVMANVAVLPLPWAKKKGRHCVSALRWFDAVCQGPERSSQA